MAPARASDPLPRAVAWIAVLAVFAYAAIVRARFLASSPTPLGIDGYFYPVQLRALLETGHLRFPSAPLTLWLMAPLAAVWGPIAGAKLGAAIGTAAATLPAYALGARVARSRAAGLVAAVLIATSPASFYLSTEFVKNGIALALGSGAVVAAMAALDRPTRARLAVAGLALIATWLAHKLAFALAVALIAPAVAVALEPAWRARAFAAAAGLALVALGLGAVFPDQLPSPGDLALVGDLLSTEAHWTLPMLDLDGRRLGFRGEIAIAAAVAAALLIVWFARRRDVPADMPRHDRALAFAAAGVCLLVAIPWLDVADPQSPAFRLRLVAFLPMAIAAAALIGALARRLAPATGTALVAGFALGLCVYRPVVYAAPVVRAQPALVDAAIRLRGRIPPGDTVVVPDRQILFMVAWYTDARVALRPDRIPVARRWRLYPSGMMESELPRALALARAAGGEVAAPVSLIDGDADGLVLVPEATWVWMLARMPDTARRRYDAWPTT